MNIKTLSAMLGGTMAFVAMNAPAVPILVAEWEGNSSPANELTEVKARIAGYNALNELDLPTFSESATGVIENMATGICAPNDPKVVQWTAPSVYDFYYIVTKFGIGQANFDHALHLVLAGETLNYNPGGDGAPNGLSHAFVWAGNFSNQTGDPVNVPDNGMPLALLGLGVLGIGCFSRR